jgi:hypothetical protein
LIFVLARSTADTMSQQPQSELRRELNQAVGEPLSPIEKKLIGWSLSLGLVLLALLTAINHLFPITP